MGDEKTESLEPGAITSIDIGPPVEGGRAVHYETEDGACGYARVRPPTDGIPMQPGERFLDMRGRDARGRIVTRELYRHGPAQVASETYRTNYDAIFAKKAN